MPLATLADTLTEESAPGPHRQRVAAGGELGVEHGPVVRVVVDARPAGHEPRIRRW